MSVGRQPGACFAALQDALAPDLKAARRDAMDSVAMWKVLQQDVERQARPDAPLRVRFPVLLQAAAEPRDVAQRMQVRRQRAQA
jgi:hypothetical protein